MIRNASAGLLLCATLVAFGCSCCHKNTCKPTPAPCCPPAGAPATLSPATIGPPPGSIEGATSTVVPPSPPAGTSFGGTMR